MTANVSVSIVFSELESMLNKFNLLKWNSPSLWFYIFIFLKIQTCWKICVLFYESVDLQFKSAVELWMTREQRWNSNIWSQCLHLAKLMRLYLYKRGKTISEIQSYCLYHSFLWYRQFFVFFLTYELLRKPTPLQFLVLYHMASLVFGLRTSILFLWSLV